MNIIGTATTNIPRPTTNTIPAKAHDPAECAKMVFETSLGLERPSEPKDGR